MFLLVANVFLGIVLLGCDWAFATSADTCAWYLHRLSIWSSILLWLKQAVVINALCHTVKEINALCTARLLIGWKQKEVPGTTEQSLAVSKSVLGGC